MRVIGGIYGSGKIVLVFTLAIIVFLYGSHAQAQTPADDQYGSPTEIGVPGAAAGQGVMTDDAAGSSGSTGAGGSSSSTGTSASPSVVTASSDGSGGVLVTALPATGGSLLSLTGLAAIALVGTGVLLFWKKSARD